MKSFDVKKMVIIIFAITVALIGAFIFAKLNLKEHNIKYNYKNLALSNEKCTFDTSTSTLSAWVAYWDLECDNEIEVLGEKLKNICYFGANFDCNNKLVINENLINYYNETKNEKYNNYITVVNDKINSDGSSVLKDTNSLKSLLNDSSLRNNHIDNIINLALKYKFDGIEIDYEKIKDDMFLWNNYIEFINELYIRAKNKGLKLRVVLEPSAPIEKLKFNEGPTYVMMCYNLHGGFSMPGEKANPNFIKKLITKMNKIPGQKEFAIATGGFNWGSDGKTTLLSENEAKKLLQEYGSKEKRDVKSQSLVFKYVDENSIHHEVWYADKTTLNYLMEPIIKKGYNVSIWRLGGNSF